MSKITNAEGKFQRFEIGVGQTGSDAEFSDAIKQLGWALTDYCRGDCGYFFIHDFWIEGKLCATRPRRSHWMDILYPEDGYSARPESNIIDWLPPTHFWAQAAERAAIWPDIDAYFDGVIDLIKVIEVGRSPVHPWEIDELQLGETAAATLALHNIRFVPFYTRLLGVWDLGHEVYQGATIVQLYKAHGWRPEIQDLIIARGVNDGQHNFEQLYGDIGDIITQHCTDLETDPFFQRLVFALDKAWRGMWEGFTISECFCGRENLSNAAKAILEKAQT